MEENQFWQKKILGKVNSMSAGFTGPVFDLGVQSESNLYIYSFFSALHKMAN